ncbi:nucleotidyl transferase AbiEii/AbiGii toxin family protein [Kribbella sp. NPDC004536]|uniref:nucleotidyl transferase AbiEii/AbiGii toxin family protein n=1 Tax=Kribbella sp. NPDC004536 TaxID=3364106 RepID=UPI003695F235
MSGKPYRNANAFRVGIERSVKAAAAARGLPAERVRRELILQRFLARIFIEPTNDWVLKGGTSLAVRSPSARYSKDIDLFTPQPTKNLLRRSMTCADLPPGHSPATGSRSPSAIPSAEAARTTTMSSPPSRSLDTSERRVRRKLSDRSVPEPACSRTGRLGAATTGCRAARGRPIASVRPVPAS